jgi:hypothetical protein
MYNLLEAPDSRRTKGENGIHLWRYGGHPRDVRALKNIDVAFVCMNLRYTMDLEQASSAVLELKPKIVYPYRYRGRSGLNDVEGFKKLVNAVYPSIEVRLRSWYE